MRVSWQRGQKLRAKSRCDAIDWGGRRDEKGGKRESGKKCREEAYSTSGIRGVRAQLEGIRSRWDSHAAALPFVFESRVRRPGVSTPPPPPLSAAHNAPNEIPSPLLFHPFSTCFLSFKLNSRDRRSASSFRGAVSRWKTGDLLGLLEEGRWKRASRFKLALGTARPFLPGSGRFVTADGVWRSETVWEARRTEASLDERPFFPLLSSKFLPGQAWPPSRHNQRRRIGREIFLPTAEISFPDFLQKSGPRFSSPRPNSPEIYHIPPRNSSKLGWVCWVGKNRCGIFG